MDFEKANYWDVRKEMDAKGITCKALAQEVGTKKENVWMTLKRYCGVPKPRGPQATSIETILHVVAAHLDDDTQHPFPEVCQHRSMVCRESSHSYQTYPSNGHPNEDLC